MQRVILIALVCLMCATAALGQIEVSAGYLRQGSQPVPGNSWFGLNGGRADVIVPLWRQFGIVGEFSGVHTGSMASSGSGLTLLGYLEGPRFSWTMNPRSRESGRVQFFVQSLAGGLHATGTFPAGSTLHSSANTFAFSAGGGVHVSLSRRVSMRLIQADYLYTRLPNLFENYQNSYRIGSGVTFRLR